MKTTITNATITLKRVGENQIELTASAFNIILPPGYTFLIGDTISVPLPPVIVEVSEFETGQNNEGDLVDNS